MQNNQIEMQNQSEILRYNPKKQLLCCKLCTDIFKKPITLTCGHTFCYYCLYKFMKQQCNITSTKNSSKIYKDLQQNHFQTLTQQKDQTQIPIPIPLCPTCCSLILRPIKHYKENLVVTNLIQKFNHKPQLKFDKLFTDDQFENFNHKLLISIQNPKIDPLPYCFNEIRFSTCFLDDILQQSHSSYVVVQWSSFKQNIGLAGKILRAQMQYHSSVRGKENCYRAYFNGFFFVKIQNKRTLEINLKSRYYTQSSFYLDNQQLAQLTICKCEQIHAENTLTLESFEYFLKFYDTLNNQHYLNQIYRIIDSRPFFDRNNPETMIYCCMRLLRLKPEIRKEMVECFDDKLRMEKINQFLESMQSSPIQDIFYISIPGKYNSALVFAIIFMLILFHYVQS